MQTVKTIDHIHPSAYEVFEKAGIPCSKEQQRPDGILMRSTVLSAEDLPDSLLAISRAGVGVNNLPIRECTQRGIMIFNTPGANANAVKELTILGLLIASRNTIGAANWVQTLKGQPQVADLCEQQKKHYSGPEIYGKKLGIIGLGAIGSSVAKAAESLGMDVYGYDPHLLVEGAWRLPSSVHRVAQLEQLFKHCDYITLHAPATPETTRMISASLLRTAKPGLRLLNFAREDLIDYSALLPLISSGVISCFVTDFCREELLGQDRIIILPHLGGSTPESEENCAVMAAEELLSYLQDGNLKNSVMLPDVSLPRSEAARLCIFHRNIPNMLLHISDIIGKNQLNIENMVNKSKKDLAYTLIDFTGDCPSIDRQLAELPDIFRVRILREN